MKLGVLLDHLPARPGGAEAHTRALLLRAVATGDEAALATMRGTAPEGVQHVPVRVRGGRPERDEAFAQQGEAALRDVGCDVVFAIRHAPRCDVYLPHGGLVREARAAKDRARGRVTRRMAIARRFSRKFEWFCDVERQLLGERKGPLVIAVSKGLRERIVKQYPACVGRIQVVVNGVDASHFAPTAFADAGAALRATWGWQDRYVGLLLARHVVLKGVETALQALCEEPVRGLSPPLGLVIAGGRLPRRLRSFVRRQRLQDAVRLVGPVDDPRPLYAAADVLVHPTWYDPCSLVCLEALSMEVPVITTPINGVREVMKQRGGIVLEAPGAPDALAVALRVLADPPLRATTADDARYLALRNRQDTRLDRILDLCRLVGERA